MAQAEVGARGHAAGTAAANGVGETVGRTRLATNRPVGPLAFAGVAVASFGGPLALAALAAPGLAADAAESSGLAMIAGAVVFIAPLAIWLRYSRHVTGAGGLYSFVEAAAGRRVALAEAAIWAFSYGLYIVYALALLIPVALATVMVAGRAATLIVLGVMAAGQLVLAGILDGVTLANISTPASTFRAGAPAGELAKASAQTSLLYICGSLPLFLGGELARPTRTIRRGVTGAFLVTAVVVVLAVAPLAAAPGLLRTEIPGVSVVEQFAGVGLARAIGIGVAVSIAGVILCEYLALTRLVHAVSGWRIRSVTIAIGAGIVVAAPFTLIDPDGLYDTLLKPSLVALWLSQLIVFAVYPLFAIKRRQRAWPACTLSLIASAFAIYGLVTTLQQASS